MLKYSLFFNKKFCLYLYIFFFLRLSPDRLKTCKKVFYDLYDNYSNPLNYVSVLLLVLIYYKHILL